MLRLNQQQYKVVNQMNKFWNVATISDNEAEITLYGEVLSSECDDFFRLVGFDHNSITPEGFQRDLEQVRNMENVTVRINSCGGDLFTGMGIYSTLKSLSAKVNVVIDGIAASAASIIAAAGDTVTVHPGSMIMIHGVSTMPNRPMQISDYKKMIKSMEANEKAIANVYAAKTGLDVDTLRSMMNKETWMTAQEAIDNGFADILDEGVQDSMTLSEDKSLIHSNGLDYKISDYINIPSSIKISKTELDKNQDLNKKEEEVKMTLEELRANHPELVAQIESEAINSVDVNAAIVAERNRISEIDEISASIPDQSLVNSAKYGEKPMTAQELAFEAIKNSAKSNANFLNALENDSKATESISSIEPVDDNQDALAKADKEFKNSIWDAYKKGRGVN